MQLGCSLPVADTGTGPAVLRDYTQAAEGLGYAHLVAPDHVLGVNPSADHGGRRVGRKRLSRSIRAVRVFVQLHPTDRLCRGCLDLGTAVGRPGGEASGLSRPVVGRPVPARHRRRLERGRVYRPQQELPQPRQALAGAGAGDAGLVGRAACPLRRRISPYRRRRHQTAPGVGRVPIWYGGHAEATFRRCAQYGDGYMPLAYPAGEAALAAFAKLRA